MSTLAAFLAAQPLLTLFLVVGVGYAAGEVSLRGLSLGVGAVLFVGLALGALVPGAAPPPLVGLLGLVMFLYNVGIQYGRQFVAGLAGPAGRRANLLALLGLAAGVGVTLAAIGAGLPVGHVTGLFAGAMTSTATLQAAIDAAPKTCTHLAGAPLSFDVEYCVRLAPISVPTIGGGGSMSVSRDRDLSRALVLLAAVALGPALVACGTSSGGDEGAAAGRASPPDVAGARPAHELLTPGPRRLPHRSRDSYGWVW